MIDIGEKNNFNDLLSVHLITILSLIEKITIILVVCVSQYKCSEGCYVIPSTPFYSYNP